MQGRGQGRCRRRGRGRGQRRLLGAVLLLELHQGPTHGYALLSGLEEFGFGDIDPSVIYRTLRDMEAEGSIASDWDAEKTQGPPRRVYRLTEEGGTVLDGWARDLAERKSRMERFLRAHARLRGGADGKRG